MQRIILMLIRGYNGWFTRKRELVKARDKVLRRNIIFDLPTTSVYEHPANKATRPLFVPPTFLNIFSLLFFYRVISLLGRRSPRWIEIRRRSARDAVCLLTKSSLKTIRPHVSRICRLDEGFFLIFHSRNLREKKPCVWPLINYEREDGSRAAEIRKCLLRRTRARARVCGEMMKWL